MRSFNGGDAEFGLITKVLETTEWTDLGHRTPLESNSNVQADLLPGPQGVLHRTYTIGGSEPRITVEVFESHEWKAVATVSVPTDNLPELGLAASSQRVILWYVHGGTFTAFEVSR